MAKLIMFKEHKHINTRTRLVKGQELFEITQSGGKGSNYSSRRESARKFIISALDHSKGHDPKKVCVIKKIKIANFLWYFRKRATFGRTSIPLTLR